MNFNGGYLNLGSVQGTPIRAHWTTAVLLIAFGGWSLGGWAAILTVVLVHELGHFLVVRAVGARVTEIVVNGMGGHCRWIGSVTARQRALIAWGGVAGQGVLFVLVLASLAIVPPQFNFWEAFTYHLTRSNLLIMLVNLIPIRPLDGAEAWKLIPLLARDFGLYGSRRSSGRDRPSRRRESQQTPPLTDRVTDPEESKRLFGKVYDGIQAPSDWKEDEAPKGSENSKKGS